MIEDEELIAMIRASATEQLPIAVMTVHEMRQFAQAVAVDCLNVLRDAPAKSDAIDHIKKRYEILED